MPAARPFLKWVGGKTQIVDEITVRFRNRLIKTYYEPMLGGGAVFFALAAQERIGRAVLNDSNLELMNCFRAVQNFPEDLIDQLKRLKINKDVFLQLREMNPDEMSPCRRAARMIYLNKTCFNGLYRVNKKGKFNAPWGKYKNPTVLDGKNLRACAEVLNELAILHCKDFVDSVAGAGPGDAIYIDPPYVPLTATSFTEYTPGGFGLKEHERLAACFRDLANRGCTVIASNSDTKIVRELYKGFSIIEIQARRSVNSDGKKRGKISELIIVGG